MTGRSEETERLQRLGAAEVIGREPFAGAGEAACPRTLGRCPRYGGLDHARPCAVDAEAGTARQSPAATPPAWTFRPASHRSSCAASALIGVDSVRIPTARREAIWNRLADNVDRDRLAVHDAGDPDCPTRSTPPAASSTAALPDERWWRFAISETGRLATGRGPPENDRSLPCRESFHERIVRRIDLLLQRPNLTP